MESRAFLRRGRSARFTPKILVFLAACCVLVFNACAYAQIGTLYYPSKPIKKISPMTAQPVTTASIYLFAVGVSGYGSNAISLLHGSGVSTDSAGNGYITSDSSGHFNLTGLYAAYCPTSTTPVYLLSRGGNAGGGNNPVAVMMSAMPVPCSQLPNVSSVFLGEATTVAAAYALAQYANVQTDALPLAPTIFKALSMPSGMQTVW